MKKSLILLMMLLPALSLLAQENLDSLRIQAEAGDAKSQMELALEYLNGDEPDEKLAFEWMQKAADQKDPKALCYLGSFYYNGIYVEYDSLKVRECLTTAADLGDDDAMNWMAIEILTNDPTDENWPQAFLYLKMSALKNSKKAFYNYGYLYENGLAVEKNLKEAYRYYLQAAHLGEKAAWKAISELYVTRLWSLKDFLNKDDEESLEDEVEELEEQ